MNALVIGVGNPLRRDDGAGLAVAELLRTAPPPGAEVRSLEHVPPDLYEEWDQVGSVFLVDAAASDAPPGTVRRFDPNLDPVPAASLRLSTHGFGLSEAIELARAFGRLPTRLTVFAVVGEDFGAGAGLSPGVEAAVRDVAARIRDELGATDA